MAPPGGLAGIVPGTEMRTRKHDGLPASLSGIPGNMQKLLTTSGA